MGNGDFEIIVLKVQGKQLGNVMFVFDNQYSALPDLADVNSDLSSYKYGLADFIVLPKSRPEISRMYHGAFLFSEKRLVFQWLRLDE